MSDKHGNEYSGFMSF